MRLRERSPRVLGFLTVVIAAWTVVGTICLPTATAQESALTERLEADRIPFERLAKTAIMKIAHLAEAFHMKCEIHHGGNSLGNVANLHVTMAIDNCDYYEVFPCSGANKFGLVEDIEVDEQGMVYAPEKPGLGYEVDWKLVEREKVGVVR